jgi:hypothetical protein
MAVPCTSPQGTLVVMETVTSVGGRHVAPASTSPASITRLNQLGMDPSNRAWARPSSRPMTAPVKSSARPPRAMRALRYGSPMMRWLVTILVAAAVSGCTLLQPSSSGGSTTGDTDGGPAVCAPTTNCADCTNCALNGPCASQYAACEASADCQAIDQCVGLCAGDPTCKQACSDNNPDGAAAYSAITTCIDCDQCPTQCAGLCTE